MEIPIKILASLPIFDRAMTLAINSHHSMVFDWILLGVSYLGEWGMIWIVIGLLILFFDHKNGKKIFGLLLIGLIIEVILNDGIIKHFLYRERPYLALANIHHLGFDWRSSSFVSGHTASAVTATIILTKYYHRFFWPMIVFVLLTMYSRIYLGIHYPTDILGGIILGAFSAYLAILLSRNIMKKQ